MIERSLKTSKLIGKPLIFSGACRLDSNSQYALIELCLVARKMQCIKSIAIYG